jgi:hypothetical protein
MVKTETAFLDLKESSQLLGVSEATVFQLALVGPDRVDRALRVRDKYVVHVRSAGLPGLCRLGMAGAREGTLPISTTSSRWDGKRTAL